MLQDCAVPVVRATGGMNEENARKSSKKNIWWGMVRGMDYLELEWPPLLMLILRQVATAWAHNSNDTCHVRQT